VQRDARNRSFHGPSISYIAHHRQRFAARQLNLADNCCKGLFPTPRYGHLRAFGSECDCAGTADSRSAAGDERYFSRKSLHPGPFAARLMFKRPGSESSIQQRAAQANAWVDARCGRLLQ
jgi:hypothetical protein